MSIGIEAFAERARRELLATGERVRERAAEASVREVLTARERQIALLVRDGLSNPEIGTCLLLIRGRSSGTCARSSSSSRSPRAGSNGMPSPLGTYESAREQGIRGELPATVDVVGRPSERRIGHQVQGKGCDVSRPDNPPDR